MNQEEKIGAEEAANVLLEGAPELSDEDVAKMREMMIEQLGPVEEPPKYNVAERFKKGSRIQDEMNGLVIVVLHAGESAMRVKVLGKKVTWGAGHVVQMDGQAFVVRRPNKNEATLEHMPNPYGGV